MKIQKILWRILDVVADTVLWGFGLVVLWLGLKVFVYASYHIPTDSMRPTLVPGDYIWVDKLAYGARLFDLGAAADGKPFAMHRTWGYSRVERNDVVVFNYPYPRTRERIEFHLLKYYVKRCIALPGDSLEIRQGHYRVRGVPQPLGHLPAQDRLQYIFTVGPKRIDGVSVKAFPKRKEFGWTILDFGPLYIPARGDVLPMDKRHYWLYRRLIEWETGQKLSLRSDGSVWLHNRPLADYRFTHDYYFMGGDNVANSVDSRYWGLVPDDFIAGKVAGIWKSEDMYTEEWRWGRIGLIE